MAKAEVSTTINRPVEEVFAVVSDPESAPKWSSGSLESTKTSTGPIGVGTTARSVSRLMGRRIETETEMIEFEPNRRFVSRSTSGPFPIQATVTVEPVDGGTRVNATIEAEPGGFFKVAEPLIVRIAKRQFQSDFDNLKDLMEANAL
ncbi:MAG: SRPBCC family protein [Chloroflexi bacterium]|nr:SRPBCC family protein [Chloroflexota bacterium]